MLILGLTGSLATGKSTVARMFAKLGAKVIDADQLTHALLSPSGASFKPVIKYFGKNIMKGGKIDREKLGQIVFDNDRKLKKLCQIIHPAVIQEIKRRLAAFYKKKSDSIVIIDAPLLIEAGLDESVDYVVVVQASLALQLKRAVNRLNLSRAEALKRIRAQMPIQEKIQRADIIIDNRTTTTETQKQVKKVWEKLSKKNRSNKIRRMKKK